MDMRLLLQSSPNSATKILNAFVEMIMEMKYFVAGEVSSQNVDPTWNPRKRHIYHGGTSSNPYKRGSGSPRSSSGLGFTVLTVLTPFVG